MRDRVPRAPAGFAAVLLVAGVAASLLLLIWALIGRQISFEQRAALRMAAEQNDDRALMLQQFVSRTLDNAELAAARFSELAANATPHRRGSPSLNAIADTNDANGGFLSTAVFNPNGALIATDAPEAWRPEDAHRVRAAFAADTRVSGPLLIGKPHGAGPRGNILWLSRRLDPSTTGLAGIVVVAVDPAQLTAIFGQAAVKPSEAAWVVGLDGTIRSRTTGGITTSGEDVSKGVIFNRQRVVAQGRNAGLGTLDHKMRLVSHRQVPGYPLFASYSILEDEVLRAARGRARLFAWGGALLSAAIILLAWMLVRAMHERERRALEAANARARLEEAQRIAQIGDWSYSLDGTQITWSPQLYEMYERDPLLGPMTREFPELLSEASRRTNRDARARLISAGLPASWEIEVRLPSGRDRIHFVSGVPTQDAAGTITGFHGTTQDVTETRRLEALQRELAHFARVGAMNSLAATLSHELTQPLAAATNYLGTGRFLAQRMTGDGAAPLVESLINAGKQVLRAGEIIKRMRSLVTLGSGERVVVPVADIVDEALATMSALRICGGDILANMPRDPLFVFCDSVQIQQVILNLVRNACEAQNDRAELPPQISVSLEGAMVAIAVRDHGAGFPEQLLGKLCQPFISSKENGLGLGLSISRTIAEAHGGSLKAANLAEGGAVVTLLLPHHLR